MSLLAVVLVPVLVLFLAPALLLAFVAKWLLDLFGGTAKPASITPTVTAPDTSTDPARPSRGCA